MSQEIEIRSASLQTANEGNTVEGYAALFDVETDLGEFQRSDPERSL